VVQALPAALAMQQQLQQFQPAMTMGQVRAPMSVAAAAGSMGVPAQPQVPAAAVGNPAVHAQVCLVMVGKGLKKFRIAFSFVNFIFYEAEFLNIVQSGCYFLLVCSFLFL
jgi:hypothetical protein